MSASPLDADASTFAGSFATAWKSVMAQASKLASARSWRRDDGQGESALAAASLDQSAGLSPPKRTAPESAIRAGPEVRAQAAQLHASGVLVRVRGLRRRLITLRHVALRGFRVLKAA